MEEQENVSIQYVPKPNGIAARALNAGAFNQRLALVAIEIDGGTQSRASLYDGVVDDYAMAIAEGVQFPPVIVFYDGNSYWMADGFHRYHAHVKAGCHDIAADIRQGTRRDAILHSVGANAEHGLRRTNEDKRRAVLTLLNDPEWVKWSDNEVAKRCGVSREYVNRLRPSVTCDRVTSERTYTTKHGTTAIMNTASIGKTVPANKDTEEEMDSPETLRSGVRMFVPEGANIVDLCRRGLELEASGATVEKAASELGLAASGYRICRQIVLLADKPDLSPKDADTAKQALDLLVSTLQWSRAWEIAEPLVVRVWGAGVRHSLLDIESARLDRFERTFGIVMQACMTTDEIDLPYLSADRVKKAVQQISGARGALKKFAGRLKEIHE